MSSRGRRKVHTRSHKRACVPTLRPLQIHGVTDGLAYKVHCSGPDRVRPRRAETHAGTDPPGAVRHRLHHRRRYFRAHRHGRRVVRGTRRHPLVRHRGRDLRAGGPVLCRARLDAAGLRLRVHLLVHHRRRIRRVDHGRAAAARIRTGRVGGRGGMVGLRGEPVARHRPRLPGGAHAAARQDGGRRADHALLHGSAGHAERRHRVARRWLHRSVLLGGHGHHHRQFHGADRAIRRAQRGDGRWLRAHERARHRGQLRYPGDADGGDQGARSRRPPACASSRRAPSSTCPRNPWCSFRAGR